MGFVPFHSYFLNVVIVGFKRQHTRYGIHWKITQIHKTGTCALDTPTWPYRTWNTKLKKKSHAEVQQLIWFFIIKNMEFSNFCSWSKTNWTFLPLFYFFKEKVFHVPFGKTIRKTFRNGELCISALFELIKQVLGIQILSWILWSKLKLPLHGRSTS